MARLRTLHIAAVPMLFVLGSLSACGSASPTSGVTSARAISTPAAPSRTPVPLPNLTPQQLIDRTVIRSSDLGPGETLRPVKGGDVVAGSVTLSNCGATFGSESHRIARRQVLIHVAGTQVGLSNEVVVYDTVADAVRALSEFHASEAGCPKGVIPADSLGDPAMTVKVLRLRRNDATLPVPSNVIAVQANTATGAGGRTIYYASYLQQSGRVLSVIWLLSPDGMDAGAVGDAQRLAVATGKRLAGLATPVVTVGFTDRPTISRGATPTTG